MLRSRPIPTSIPAALRWAVLALLLGAAPARALTQPGSSTLIPTPVIDCQDPGSNTPGGLDAVFACQCLSPIPPGQCNIGAPCPGGSTSCDQGQNNTCEERVWHDANDNSCVPSNAQGIDPQAEAATTPETFSPSCPLTFTLASRGTAQFHDVFGWYNVTGSKPASSDLHVMLDCSATPGTQVVLDLTNNPAYQGGDVGFFLVTPQSSSNDQCANGDCCATVDRADNGQGYVYYSERTFDPDQNGANSYIHLLIYNSHITPRKFYFAWEDMYGGTSSDDFTDLVTGVEGIECSGGGVSCDTGLPGVCNFGVKSCATGVLACTQVYQPSAEVCDGLDNDCNGKVDDGATCPDAGDVCWNGICVPHCANSEFDVCPADLTCDPPSGLCLDPTCTGVVCPPDQVCRNGACGDACDGVVCPHGRTCRLGNCLDPCKGVTCTAGQVCAEGLCMVGCNECGGLTCSTGLTCDMSSGTCGDPSCSTPCPAGTYCASGTCKDACDGAVCPQGEVCAAGDCVLASLVDGGANNGNVGDGGNTTGGDGGGTNGGRRSGLGCACHMGAGPLPPLSLVLFALVAGLLLKKETGQARYPQLIDWQRFLVHDDRRI